MEDMIVVDKLMLLMWRASRWTPRTAHDTKSKLLCARAFFVTLLSNSC